jgi:hypothetical protein
MVSSMPTNGNDHGHQSTAPSRTGAAVDRHGTLLILNHAILSAFGFFQIFMTFQYYRPLFHLASLCGCAYFLAIPLSALGGSVSTFDSFELAREARLEKLQAHVRRSRAITPELLTEVMAEACIRFFAYGNATKALFNQLVAHGAWTDAVLLLLQFELPQWKLKRILYDDGEWHCFLSKQPQFPLGFDEGAEARHEVLPLAMLIAFIKARSAGATAATSVPQVSVPPNCIVCCDNFA